MDAALWSAATAVAFNPANLKLADARSLYLFGPVRLPLADGTAIKVRTSLEAALTDARRATDRDDAGRPCNKDRSRYWLGASAYLMLIDQLATVFDYGHDGFETILHSRCGLPLDHAGALYGLRNAFVHSYGLVNEPRSGMSAVKRLRRRHGFNLHADDESPLVMLGDRRNAATAPLAALAPTAVNIARVADLVEAMVANIRQQHIATNDLPWKTNDISTFAATCFFKHLDPIALA